MSLRPVAGLLSRSPDPEKVADAPLLLIEGGGSVVNVSDPDNAMIG